MRLLFKTIGAEQIELSSSFSIGNGEADVSFPDDKNLSSIHGHFIVEGGRGYIMDNNSATGILLNDVKIPTNQKIELEEGACIRFGDQIVFFTKEDKFQAIPGESTIVSQTGKELLAKARKVKEAKVNSLEEKCYSINAMLKNITDGLDSIKSKIDLANKAIADAEVRQQEIREEVKQLTTNKDAIRKSYDDKKNLLAKRQITLKDKLQLLELAQAPDSQKQPIQDELKQIAAEITVLDDEKKKMPQKIIEMNNKQGLIEKKSSEYKAQREKLMLAFEERKNKHQADIHRLKEELQTNKLLLAKARENLKK